MLEEEDLKDEGRLGALAMEEKFQRFVARAQKDRPNVEVL